MKPIKDILGDTKPKNVKKVTKAYLLDTAFPSWWLEAQGLS